ncbi:hypothetical protein CDL12_10034 [Handroanthus impetiginosus]|uniref:BRCT domain-containing protein n=1 Tax=Handroanthus impetiginosus TaxID=429701 RepID=A0A2G9HIG4_9LAMI|nr:hypothetical protein CDL12_10034 [Handroanthus impetiginosus]
MATVSDSENNFSAQDTEPDLENFLPNIYPPFSEAPPLSKEEIDPPDDKGKNDSNFAQCVADDSQSDSDDLYLSECRILLVGFEASELRKLVDMVRRGGGSRYVCFREKLTHIIVGNPSEIEIKEIRSLAAFGIIYVVKAAWLEECNFKKKEVPVLQSHIAYDLLLPKEPVFFSKSTASSMTGVKRGKTSVSQPVELNIWENKNSQSEVLLHKKEAKLNVLSGFSQGIKPIKSSTVFQGKLFRFSSYFPEEHRPEVVVWIKKGGGEVVTDQNEKNVDFTVEKHGVAPCLSNVAKSTYVSSHWILSCLEDGCLLDVSSHVLYSPLQCQIPLPGFERYRLCVSQYDMKEKQLLRNLCYVLGGEFSIRLTKKVTHLLCKFADGDKYEAACRSGIHTVTSEWIYECVLQNTVVDLKGFHPKELTSQDREAGLYSVSQYPSQYVKMTSVDVQTVTSSGCIERDEENYSNRGSKKAKLLGNDNINYPLSYASTNDNFVDRKNPTENTVTENTREVSSVVPDVAAAIEDLLEQTSKIQDRKAEETSSCHENFLSSNSTMLRKELQSDPGPSKHWMNRLEKGDDNNPSAEAAARGLYDGFSETQTDSQVVGYEEDLSGRQMIIDRVRTRSSMA